MDMNMKFISTAGFLIGACFGCLAATTVEVDFSAPAAFSRIHAVNWDVPVDSL